eukprot:6033018-Pyramimonas_sp.AAC.1
MGYSKETLKRMARCYAMVRYGALRARVKGALGDTLKKKGDMMRAVGCAKGMGTWFEKLGACVEDSKGRGG